MEIFFNIFYLCFNFLNFLLCLLLNLFNNHDSGDVSLIHYLRYNFRLNLVDCKGNFVISCHWGHAINNLNKVCKLTSKLIAFFFNSIDNTLLHFKFIYLFLFYIINQTSKIITNLVHNHFFHCVFNLRTKRFCLMSHNFLNTLLH